MAQRNPGISGLPHWLSLRVACHLVTADRLTRFMSELRNGVPDGERDLLIAAFRELLRPGGFGILIARHVADELVYNERSNEVLMITHLS